MKVTIMEIEFEYIDEDHLSEDYKEQFLQIIFTTAQLLNIEDDLELSCIIVDDNKIHEINKDYRQIDKSTDVISFAMEDNDQYYVAGMPRSLGDIFISIDHAKTQAKDYGHSLKREMCFLFTHGLLHLLGYDHMNEDDEKEMFDLQKQILTTLQIERK